MPKTVRWWGDIRNGQCPTTCRLRRLMRWFGTGPAPAFHPSVFAVIRMVMSEANEDVDWTNVSEDMARQILAQGELYLQGQVQLALAADQRATTAASIFASTAAAVVAAFIAFWDDSQDRTALLSGLIGAAFLMTGALAAAWAARPVNFEITGNHPRQWYAGRTAAIVPMIGGEAESVQRRIDANDKRMAINHAWLRAGFNVAMLAPVASLVAWLWVL